MKQYLLLFFILLFIYNFCDTKEGFSDRDLYKILMDDFQTIFPDRNRNAGGPQFYNHIVSMNPTIDEFIRYNKFYCAVSGSPIDPDRKDIYDNIVVKDKDNKEYYGKYYRCCMPCSCDIMRNGLVLLEEHNLSLKDGEYKHHVLTIKDPCLNENNIPSEITCFKCQSDKTQNGIHSDSGRLIMGILHEVDEYNNQDISFLEKCSDRNSTPIDDLIGGMGDISLKLYSL